METQGFPEAQQCEGFHQCVGVNPKHSSARGAKNAKYSIFVHVQIPAKIIIIVRSTYYTMGTQGFEPRYAALEAAVIARLYDIPNKELKQ